MYSSWKVMQRLSLHESPEPGAADPPAVPADDPTLEGGDPPPLDVPTISVETLPEELRGLPEAEIKFHLGQMVRGIQGSNQRNRELEDRLRSLETAPPPAPEAPVEPAKPLEELILEDPEQAIMNVLESRGLTTRFDRMEAQVGENAFTSVASKVPGFEEYEEDIRTIIRQSGVAASVENITGALHMAVGRKSLEDQGRTTRAASTAQIPVNDPPPPKGGKTPELAGLEKEIQEASGMTPEDYVKYKDVQNFDIKVPTS